MIIPWLEPLAERWRQQCVQGRAPHAVMLQGMAGLGKRCAAAWLARRWLVPGEADDGPGYPLDRQLHPDLYWLQPLPDKLSIGVGQVRELIDELSLTSHDGGGKVAVIDPANAMTASAANSLLKTLEEPPGAALIVLVADKQGGLPATILSRCQRITVRVPEARMALNWLDKLQPANNWGRALAEAGGAPLAAVAVREEEAATQSMARDLEALSRRVVSPVEVADRWLRAGIGQPLDWLAQQVQACIRQSVAGTAPAGAPVVAESVLQRIDSRNLFCYLDIINRLRSQAAGSYEIRLTFESLLIDWAEGLKNCRRDALGIATPMLLDAR